ncbi:MAG: DNA mismatch repair endonuclease MutL [Chlamydiales bacterium]
MKIKVLDEIMINQIAAGEVIPNTASVVKELMDNALDANAAKITIEIESGGRQKIRVLDNGCGMVRDDALLCLERHATSKIREFDDLHRLATMGFRGEAVPSIASISKFVLITQPLEGEGTLVVVEGGKILKVTEAARDPGTTIEVKSLFFNVPVRKKFQRSPSYDVQEILRVVNGHALANPEVAFELISDFKTLLHVSEEDLRERVKHVLGDAFITATKEVNFSDRVMSVKGFIGYPSFHAHNRLGQYLFVNRRAVYSKAISEAVREGYGTVLPSNRHPQFALFIEMDGGDVDVNVHPQKREIRFREERKLKEFISQGIAKALQNSYDMPTHFDSTPVPSFQPTLQPVSPFVFNTIQAPVEEDTIVDQVRAGSEIPLQASLIAPESYDEKPTIPKVIGSLPGYLFLQQDPTNLFVLDQRRAHHRVLYEQAVQGRANDYSQTLLIPHIIEVTKPEATLMIEGLHEINKTGIVLREIGPTAFAIDAIPSFVHESELSDLIKEVIASLRKDGDMVGHEKKELAFLSQLSLKCSMSRERCLSSSEGQSLVEQLYQCRDHQHCPYGKPILMRLDKEKISKLF